MGTVAISEKDEDILLSLQKALQISSKSQVIHRALENLQESVAREKLAREIQKSVLKCGKEDLKEHQFLTGAAAYRLEGG